MQLGPLCKLSDQQKSKRNCEIGELNLVFEKRTGWIGVDVGTHTVKLAQVVRVGGGLRLRQAVVIQRPSPWPAEDSMAWALPNGSFDEISAGRSYGNFVGRSAASVLPMNICELHGLTVPQGSDREREAMIASELAEDWADRPSPMEFGFWETDTPLTNDRAGGFNVNVLSVSQLWIARLTQDCRNSSLDCWSIDGCPLAMARAVSLVSRYRNEQCVLVVDWGYSNVTASIVTNRRALYVRKLRDCGLRRLLDCLSAELGVTEDEAQHLIDSQGLVGSGQDAHADREVQNAIATAAHDTIVTMVDQLERTLQFVDSQRRHLVPNAVWLMGGGATIRNVGPRLEAELQMPVHIWSMPTDTTQLAPLEGQRSALFGTAAALSALAWRAA
jgi:type IV pilus assembly protein PilM